MEYFNQSDLITAKKKRNILLAVVLTISAVYAAISAVFLVFYLRLPYKSPTILPLKIGHHAVSAVFVIVLFFILAVPLKRAKRLYRALYNMEHGIRETNTGSFFEYDETLQEKDGVDYKALVFLEWNKYKNDMFERKVLVFYDKPFPEFNENDNVRFITQGNVLISYEIL